MFGKVQLIAQSDDLGLGLVDSLIQISSDSTILWVPLCEETFYMVGNPVWFNENGPSHKWNHSQVATITL